MNAILRRGFLVPWLLSAAVMYGLSYVWHGLALTDLEELNMPLGLYMGLTTLVYLVIGFVLTVLIDQGLLHDYIKLKKGFPFVSFLLGGVIGFLVYLTVLTLGISFSASNVKHVLVDIIWQMVEQGFGGLMVSFGIIYDVRRIQVEMEGG
jgi:hypothetical protein